MTKTHFKPRNKLFLNTMEEENGEVYSTIFSALRHGVRRNILRMLNQQELPFSAMEEALSLSSSHLTYHLDALKELVTKTETGYKLSIFGQAAVEMIERVENPPQEIAKRRLRYRQISVILLAVTLLTSGLFGYTQIQLNTLNDIQADQKNQIAVLTKELEPYEALKEQLETRPETHFSKGVFAVVGWTVEYEHDFNEDPWYSANLYPPYYYAMFYAPSDNLTLFLEPGKYLTPDYFAYPLTIQKGNAWWNESGVKQVEYYGNESFVSWVSPVIWQQNVSRTDIIEIQLEEMGWYTLCMTGPIKVNENGSIGSRFGVVTHDEEGNSYPVYANIWIDFKLLDSEGDAVLFNIWSRG